MHKMGTQPVTVTLLKSDTLETITCESIDVRVLTQMLQGRLPPALARRIKRHVDVCETCWRKWNNLRWDRAKERQGYLELKEYLGEGFQEYFDSSWALAREWEQRDPRTSDAVEMFYSEVPYYVYNLTIWHESGDRLPYVSLADRLLRKHRCSVILDYGCGIGSDGLRLLELGYRVIFCDFDGPSIQFLRWRLQKRGLVAPIIHPGDLVATDKFDTIWAIDVIEHLAEPMDYLAPLLRQGRVFMFNAVQDRTAFGRHPFHFHHSQRQLHEQIMSQGYRRDSSARYLKCFYRT